MMQAIKRIIEAYRQRQKVKAMRQAKLIKALAKVNVLDKIKDYSFKLELTSKR